MADNILRIGTEFDVGPLVAGAQTAGAATDELKAKIAEAGATATVAGTAFTNVGAKMGEASKEALNLLYPTEAVDTAQRENVATSNELATALAALVTQLKATAAAKNEVTGAARGMTGAMGAARVEMGLLEGSTGMIAGGLARVAAQSSVLAPLIQAAFVPLAVVAFADIAIHAAEAIYKVYQNVVLLKSTIDALQKAQETEATKAAELNFQYDESTVKRLESQRNLLESQGRFTEALQTNLRVTEEINRVSAEKPLTLPKIDDKFGKQLDDQFKSFLSATHNIGDAQVVIDRVGAEADSTATQLAKAKQAAEGLNQILREPSTDPSGILATEEALKREEKNVENLQGKYDYLKTVIGTVQSQTGISSNERIAKTEADFEKEKTIREKQVDLQTTAAKAGLEGPSGRVEAIQLEIAALDKKQKIETDIANQERAQVGAAPLKPTDVSEEFVSKRLALTKELQVAQESLSREEIAAMDRWTADQAKAEDSAVKLKLSQEQLATAIKDFGNAAADKSAKFDLSQYVAQVGAAKKLTEELGKADDEEAAHAITMQEQVVTAQKSSSDEAIRTAILTTDERIKAQTEADVKSLEETRTLEEQRSASVIQGFEDDQAALGSRAADLAARRVIPETAADFEILANWQKLQDQIVAAKNKSAEELGKIDEKIIEANKKAADQMQLDFANAAQKINQTFLSEFDNVLKGTDTVRQGFYKMLGQLELDAINWAAKDLLIHAENELRKLIFTHTAQDAMTASVASNTAARETIEKTHYLQNIVEIGKEALTHGTAETAKTLQTTTGVTARETMENTHYLKNIVQMGVDLTHHTATETGKTIATGTAQAGQTAAVAAGTATRAVDVGTANTAEVLSEAAVTYAGAFASVIASLPFPANVAAAPAVASAAMASVLAEAPAAAFQRGGIVADEGMAHLHEKEMVLPAGIAQPLIGVIPAIQNFNKSMSTSSVNTTGGDVHNHFGFPTHIGNMQALDGVSVRSMLEKHGDLVGAIAIAAVKRHFRTNGIGG